MEELINQFLSRKFRKQGKAFRLAENSKLSGQDFAYANRMASMFYRHAKQIIPNLKDRNTFQRIVKLMLTMLRQDDHNELGELRLGNGNVGKAEGFRLLTERIWEDLYPGLPEITCKTEGSLVEITIMPFVNWPAGFYTPNVRKVHLQFHVILLPFQTDEPSGYLQSKPMVLELGQPVKRASTQMKYEDGENCLLFVVGSISCSIQSATNNDVFLSINRKYRAAEVLKVFRIKNGILLNDQFQEDHKPTPKTEPEDEGTDWV